MFAIVLPNSIILTHIGPNHGHHVNVWWLFSGNHQVDSLTQKSGIPTHQVGLVGTSIVGLAYLVVPLTLRFFFLPCDLYDPRPHLISWLSNFWARQHFPLMINLHPCTCIHSATSVQSKEVSRLIDTVLWIIMVLCTFYCDILHFQIGSVAALWKLGATTLAFQSVTYIIFDSLWCSCWYTGTVLILIGSHFTLF